MNPQRVKLGVGLLIHTIAVGLLVAFLLGGAVREPAGRIVATLASGLDAERESDLVLDVDTTEGLEVGLPAFVIDEDGAGRPVAHVLGFDGGADGGRVRLRFEPGEGGAYRVVVYPPRRGLREAYHLAVPEGVTLRFGEELERRLLVVWNEELKDDITARLPAFFERIDPRGDNNTRKTLDALGGATFERLKPHLDDLVADMTGAIAHELSAWERVKVTMGFLVLGPEHIKKKLQPIAEDTARVWWEDNRDAVLTSLGDAVVDHLPDIAEWIGSEFLDAARDELVLPALDQHRRRLEAEGEALIRMVLDDVIRVPEGGFQVRFAAMLRHVLLRKGTALVVLEPLPLDDA